MGEYYYYIVMTGAAGQEFVVGPYADEAAARESAVNRLPGIPFEIRNSTEKDLGKAIDAFRDQSSHHAVQQLSNRRLAFLLLVLLVAAMAMGFGLAVVAGRLAA